jgi:hypothetical protein
MPDQDSELLEQLASIEHERWSHWQRYMHGKATRNLDGSLTIPADLVTRWERLMETPYARLTNEERESDREQVRRYLTLVAESYGALKR